MFMEVVGASGSKNSVDRIVCMRLGEKVLIDAGSASFIPYRQLNQIEAIILTHAHLDHILDLGFVLDSLVPQRETPLVVMGSEACISIIKAHYMNGLIWPDFTRIYSNGNPVLEYRVIDDFCWTDLPGGVSCMAVPVNHPAGARGFLFRHDGFTLVYSGDTGPTHSLWETAAAEGDVSALVIEVSFPDSSKSIALAADHLCPSLAAAEMAKLGKDGFPVYIFHMKPWFSEEIERDLSPLGSNARFLHQGDRIEFSRLSVPHAQVQ